VSSLLERTQYAWSTSTNEQFAPKSPRDGVATPRVTMEASSGSPMAIKEPEGNSKYLSNRWPPAPAAPPGAAAPPPPQPASSHA